MKTSIILIIQLLVSFNLDANIYYVETNGNNSNPGTEIQPWKTIQKAANTLVAGDTVFIKGGTYNERVVIQNSGTPNNYVVFSNYQNDTVIVDGSGISWGSNWNGLFDISGKSYIKISGLNIKNADYGGFWIENSDHIVIENSCTYNTFSSGIGVWNSSFITIKNNEVELACNDGEQECITVSNSSNCEISQNNVHNNGSGANGGEGIDIKQGSHDVNVFNNSVHHLNERIGIYADAWDRYTYNINIYQNTVHDCGNNGMVVQSEMGGTIEYVSFYNNIVYRNKWDGIAVGSVTASDTVSSTPVHHIKIINNTLYKNGGISNGWGFGILVNNPDAKDITIRNNICSENSAQIGVQQINSGEIIDHNLFYGNNTASGAVYGNDSIIGNPLFINSNSFDFHLQVNSPAIDNGSSANAPVFDFDNNKRPTGLGFDIGACEYVSGSNTPENRDMNKSIKIYPNPVTDKLYVKINGNKYQKYSFQLFNLNGKLIRKAITGKTKEDLIFIDTKDLVSGLYILNILTDNKMVISKKLVIE